MKGFDLPRQIAFEMRQGQFPPTPRACHDHGCRCFRLRQVDPVVQEGPFGKFAGICKADPGPYNLAQDGLYEQKTARRILAALCRAGDLSLSRCSLPRT